AGGGGQDPDAARLHLRAGGGVPARAAVPRRHHGNPGRGGQAEDAVVRRAADAGRALEGRQLRRRHPARKRKGHAMTGQRIWANLLLDGFYALSLCVGAMFFIASQRVTSARWSAGLRRVPEGFLGAIPILSL